MGSKSSDYGAMLHSLFVAKTESSDSYEGGAAAAAAASGGGGGGGGAGSLSSSPSNALGMLGSQIGLSGGASGNSKSAQPQSQPQPQPPSPAPTQSKRSSFTSGWSLKMPTEMGKSRSTNSSNNTLIRLAVLNVLTMTIRSFCRYQDSD